MNPEQRLHHALRNGGREQIFAAYDDVMADEMPKRGWFANQAVTVEQAAPLADAKCAEYRAYNDALSAEDKARLEANAAEVAERKARINSNGGDYFSRHGFPRDSKGTAGYGVSID